MRVLFTGEVFVHYGFVEVHSRDEREDDHERAFEMDDHFAGQSAGLCGAAIEGVLFLQTALHTGDVGLTVESHEEAPALGDWEEVVEATFTAESAETALVEPFGTVYPLELEPGRHRVRYCASGMDEAREGDPPERGEPSVDQYLLQLWPAPAEAADSAVEEPFRVIRRTSASAAYWHDWAAALPPPPTPEELATREAAKQAEAERRKLLERERAATRRELNRWGGQLPSERLRRLEGNVPEVVRLDRELCEALAQAEPALQRALAHWAARRAFTLTGLAERDWVAPALVAMERGQGLPPPFDDPLGAWDLLLDAERIPISPQIAGDRTGHKRLRQAMVVPALLEATDPDPLRAALEALFAMVFACGRDYREVVVEARRCLPASP